MRLALGCLCLCLLLPGVARPSELCELEGPEYLQDADFALEAADRRSKHWTGIQHAGERSFVPSIEAGVLRIEKVGTQPWYIYRQRIKPGDLGGKLMAFTAELQLDLQKPEASGMARDGGGLQLTVRTRNGQAYSAEFPHEPHIGETDWFTAQLVVRIPKNAAIIEPAFRHQADGVLNARNVSFREVKGSCELTPGLAPD